MGNTLDTVFGICLLLVGVVGFAWTWKQYQQGRGTRQPANSPQRDMIITSGLGGLASLALGASFLLPTSGAQAIIGDVGLIAALLGFVFTARVGRAMMGTKR